MIGWVGFGVERAGGWVAGLSKNKANSVKPVETGVELGLSLATLKLIDPKTT